MRFGLASTKKYAMLRVSFHNNKIIDTNIEYRVGYAGKKSRFLTRKQPFDTSYIHRKKKAEIN